MVSEKNCLLRIYIGESDRHGGKPLHEAIALKARELGLAGATVLRGIMGYGSHTRIHSAKILDISGDLPLVVEIVDSGENIGRLMPFLESAMRGGLVTTEEVNIHRFPRGEQQS